MKLRHCHPCNALVRNLGRHYRRHHPWISLAWRTPTPPLPGSPDYDPTANYDSTATTSNTAKLWSPSAHISSPETERKRSPRSSPSPALPPSPDGAATEDWDREPLCSITLPEEAPAESGELVVVPAKSGDSASPPAESGNTAAPPAKSEELPSGRTAAGTEVGRYVTQGTQLNGRFDHRDRVRKRLFTSSRAQLYIVPRETGNDPPLSVEEARYASEVPINQRRYLCDCRRCIGHALELENVDNPYGVPSEFELRFVTLPRPKLTLSNDPLRRQLMDLYHRRPELSLTVCGCRYCTLHRNLAKAWLQVWQS